MNSREIVNCRLNSIKSENENKQIVETRLKEVEYKLKSCNIEVVKTRLNDCRDIEQLSNIVDSRINELIVRDRLYDINYK